MVLCSLIAISSCIFGQTWSPSAAELVQATSFLRPLSQSDPSVILIPESASTDFEIVEGCVTLITLMDISTFDYKTHQIRSFGVRTRSAREPLANYSFGDEQFIQSRATELMKTLRPSDKIVWGPCTVITRDRTVSFFGSSVFEGIPRTVDEPGFFYAADLDSGRVINFVVPGESDLYTGSLGSQATASASEAKSIARDFLASVGISNLADSSTPKLRWRIPKLYLTQQNQPLGDWQIDRRSQSLTGAASRKELALSYRVKFNVLSSLGTVTSSYYVLVDPFTRTAFMAYRLNNLVVLAD